MKRFATVAAVALMGFAASSAAGADQRTRAEPGSVEARMRDCMKYASKSVCEKRIKGPGGQPETGSNSEQDAMEKCMKFASQSACERKIIGP